MMNEVVLCKKCGSGDIVKAGFVGENQRYICRRCRCQFQPNRRGRQMSASIIEILNNNGE